MKITVLTSSRSDYSIYLPLLKALKEEPEIEIDLIAFGTHLSKKYGNTVNSIIEDGFQVSHMVDTLPEGDSPFNISEAIGNCIIKFSKIWEDDTTDLIIALGDRYEMFAACSASLPFGKKIAHIHGGETTKGAIDDFFRNSISLLAQVHFVTTNEYREKVISVIGNSENVYNVGALSIDNLKNLNLLTIESFQKKYSIDLSKPSILITFHPETVDFEKNELNCLELISALNKTSGYQFIITMPNSDTMGLKIRELLNEFILSNVNAIAIESFGTIGYLSCMKHCSFMLGNTSSGFVEASFFPKYVINLGNRQNGRIVTENMRNCPINSDAIKKVIDNFHSLQLPDQILTYGNGTAANQIVSILKNLY